MLQISLSSWNRRNFAVTAASVLASLFFILHNTAAAERLPGPMLADALEGPLAGVEEIVFAVRSVGADGHWYANFGHRANDENQMNYGPDGGKLCRLNLVTGELVAYFGKLKGLPAAVARERAEALLVGFGLGDWIDKKTEALSKGMSQKVQILSTLIHEPELVILDEPFAGLDPVNVQVVREVILDMKRQGRTVIFSTHVMEQAEQICDYIFLINKGRKVLDGTIAEVRRTGDEAVVVDYEGDGSILKRLRGVRRVSDAGKTAEIFLAEGTNPQDILKQLVGQLQIRRFDMREPSLHEVFIRAVGGETDA